MPVAFSLVTPPSDAGAPAPSRWLMFLHGILGSGSNWRSFARQVVTARPDWGAVLVDLRLHGESRVEFSRPHTVEAAARDLLEVVDALPGPLAAVLGHSFGGKVALELASHVPTPLECVFVVDSTPSARPEARGSESTRAIVDLLATLPEDFADRAAFVSWLEQRRVDRPIAMWLAMNLRPVPNSRRYVFRIDVAAVRELLDDYFVRDMWNVVEHPPVGLSGAPSVPPLAGCVGMQTHFIVGDRSSVVDANDRKRAAGCACATVDIVPNAGHWVHVDAPDIVRDLVLKRL